MVSHNYYFPALNNDAESRIIRLVVAADSLFKRDVFRLPDPFAVITVDAEQTHTTSVIKKTLNPYWNESFDMFVAVSLALNSVHLLFLHWIVPSRTILPWSQS